MSKLIDETRNRYVDQTKNIRIHYYNIGALSLLKNIKDNSIDLVLIDPPYEISKETNFINTKIKGDDTDRFRIDTVFGDWDKDFIGLEDIIRETYRVLRSGGYFICFYDIWKITDLKNIMERSKYKQIRFIEWVKTNPVPINSKINYLTNSREIALTGVKVSKSTFNSSYDNGIYNYPIYSGKDRIHPTQKSLKLFIELIEKHSNKGDYVLDCFSGSATTAVAALKTGRNFIGCEIDKDYYNISVERIISRKESVNGYEIKTIFTKKD